MPSTGRPACTATQSGVSEPQVGREVRVRVLLADLLALAQSRKNPPPLSGSWKLGSRPLSRTLASFSTAPV